MFNVFRDTDQLPLSESFGSFFVEKVESLTSELLPVSGMSSSLDTLDTTVALQKKAGKLLRSHRKHLHVSE